ncbi:type VI secretion system baseplate subunit TssE [Paraburkholderia sp. MMS20-SJTN17]|uniref:Type VI secretion system baseplate subunit TssE n=1 Tax=Paraburkholderia translucens TaxID=2886945 RepID=A0ABS8KDW1_9BURK|nr:type VI secretion system baseplate subunit TssE [Paraburkholderia sp. MMS20-SJTN17]MCC8402951.1 type VI secretion system baseplate subunit TssE [Paraburkholderia sp. MMS20-SJTN17]
MYEPSARDRLQPSLLDRLTDLEPHVRHESRERRVISARALRDSVQRDIGWLLNASALGAGSDGADLPHVATSVLNYGLPDLAGRDVAALTAGTLERLIRDALWAFEPRLARESVRVTAIDDAKGTKGSHVIRFEIEADLWSQPYPERLFLRTELDLEAGEARVFDASSTRAASAGEQRA